MSVTDTGRAAAEAEASAETSAAEPRIRPLSPRTWADIAVLLVLTTVGVLGFTPSFGGFSFLLAGFGGLVVGAATGILTAVFGARLLTSVFLAILAYFVFGTAFAVPDQALFVVLPTLQSLASIAIGSVYGWADIVTLSTPVGAPQYIAVVPYAAAWIVALVSTMLATRWLAHRPRAAWRFAVLLVGPVALYVGGILIGTDEPYQAGIRGVAFGVLALIWLGWRRPTTAIAQAGAKRLRNRKLAGTAVIVASAVVLGSGAGFLLAPPNDERFVLREEIEPPFDPLDYPSPLAGFRHYTKQVTDDVLFTVQGLESGDVIRLATLDSFTGKLWNVSSSQTGSGSGAFELVGRQLPQPSLITPVERKNITFTIDQYADVWVPGVGYPVDFAFTGGAAAEHTDDLRYNSATGTTVLTSGLAEGDTYTLDAEVQQVLTTDELADVSIAAVPLAPVDGSPDIVTVRAQELVGTSTTPISQLESIRLALAETGFLSHGRASDSVPSRAGHGADRINELFERNQMIGDQEQYASAFALMATTLGYPARVVMGFAPDIAEGQSTVEVTGDDVTAWVEVAFESGWVAFNPTPDETDIPQDQVPKPQSEPQPQVRQPPRADNDDEDLLSPVELEEQEKKEQDFFSIPGWVIVLGLSILIPAALFFIPLFIVAAIKARRAKRRRTSGEPHDRVAGAWEELMDRYAELGFAVPKRVTRKNAAERLEAQVETEAPLGLATIARETDQAVFSGEPVADDRSEVVWTEALAAVEVARGTVSGLRRLVSRFRIRTARAWAARKPKNSPPST